MESPQTNLAQKKRILFVITQSELGGAQQFVAQLTARLDKNKFSFAVVAGTDGGDGLRNILPKETEYITARFLRRDTNIFSDVRSLFELRNIYRTQKPDIIFLNSSKAGFNGSLAARFLPGNTKETKVIYRIGGWSFNDPQSPLSRRFRIFLEKFSAGWKDYIVVNNSLDLKLAGQYKIRPRMKTMLIHNGIDPYRTVLGRDDARIKLLDIISHRELERGLGGQKPLFQAEYLVGTIANFYPTKGLETLIRAAALVPENTSFVIIGDGKLRPGLERLIHESGLAGRVHLAGRIADASQFLPAFDLFVLPSLKEGFPWTILEAIVARVPVIATNVGAIPEILEDGKTGFLVPPGDSEILAKRIAKLLNDSDIRRQMSLEAHQTLLKRFTLQQMAEQYERLFLAV